ncbi:MAG: BLUF domain-containing protein [Burkholderiales bacterium]|nr:MAG: BLUF domain-containing protein [Burkholderiales bacterium]
MIRLVYVSTCAPGLGIDDVYAIMKVSQPWNVQHELSGMLCWSGEFFLQCLEGDRSEVSKIFAKIATDRRHHSVELLIAAPTNVRWFGEWGMGFSQLMASHRLDLPRGRGESFNPYLLQAVDLERTFEQLATFAQRLAID